MTIATVDSSLGDRAVVQLTKNWGDWKAVSLYLDRCQVDTPDDLVSATWAHVFQKRKNVGKVVDFGAGDGRFAKGGVYAEYVGYEIDELRCRDALMPSNAKLVNSCAFSNEIVDADLCIGNPPFVRNQDLPVGWRHHVSAMLKRRTGLSISGLANAWQYFFLLGLTSVKNDGLCVLVIPYEWVSRPSARLLRNYIKSKGWSVEVYRLVDRTFDSVLTTASITIVDKSVSNGAWSYFEESTVGAYRLLPSPSGSQEGVINYSRRSDITSDMPKAVRGLSPGTQKVLTLTEGERVRYALEIDVDVVPCVTSLRRVPPGIRVLDQQTFRTHFRDIGQKCWLLRTDRAPSQALQSYLSTVPAEDYQTATCLGRKEWWKFRMPSIPAMLMSQSFREGFPKVVCNMIGARAVGGVCGVYNLNSEQAAWMSVEVDSIDIRDRIVAHSNGLRKIEINQLNTLLRGLLEGRN